MIRSFITVSTGTLASRLLGFARDAMIAALLGTGPIADALLVAFQLVNVVRRLLSEGALNAALVPAWLRVRETEGVVEAAAFAGRVLGTISAALVVATALIGLLMPLVITALAPGFAGQPTLQLAVNDARLMLPYLAFAGPVTVMMALMSAQGRFALTAFSPLLFNIALIGVMAVLLGWRSGAHDAALVIAATVGVAGLLQLLVLGSRGRGLATPLRVAFDAQMRGFLGKAIPGMIASSGAQWLLVAGAIIASSSPSAVSWLYFANRLIELPLGIVGVAMGTVLVPELTRALRGADRAAVIHAESRALELAVGLALPATLGLIVLSEPVVWMLFQHRAFTSDDTMATAQALTWLLRARRHADAAGGRLDGICGRDRLGPGTRPLARRRRHRRRHRARSMEQRAGADSARRRDLRIFDRRPGAQAAATHRCGRAGDGWAAVASVDAPERVDRGDPFRRAGRSFVGSDCRGSGDLRPVAGPVRGARLARCR